MQTYIIAKEWASLLPGKRIWDKPPYDDSDGIYFFEKVLEPFYLDNKEGTEQMMIDFDGMNGFIPVSFLEDAFGTFVKGYQGVSDPEFTRLDFKGYGVRALTKCFQIKAITCSYPPDLFRLSSFFINVNN